MIGTVLTISTILGVLAFMNLRRSERVIHDALQALDTRGKALSADECVSAVLAWHGTCDAMKSLCDHAIPRAMEHCLVARDRTDECGRLIADDAGRGQWTFDKCAALGIDKSVPRAERNACTDAYRAVAQFCATGQKAVFL